MVLSAHPDRNSAQCFRKSILCQKYREMFHFQRTKTRWKKIVWVKYALFSEFVKSKTHNTGCCLVSEVFPQCPVCLFNAVKMLQKLRGIVHCSEIFAPKSYLHWYLCQALNFYLVYLFLNFCRSNIRTMTLIQHSSFIKTPCF